MSINKDLSSIRVFSTENTEYFTQEIVKRLGCKYVNVIHKVFGDGENYYRIDIEDSATGTIVKSLSKNIFFL